MNHIRQKLRSRTGASITFALLLFLVCAVLSSVIIVAATAAAGRIAGMVEADQRYYAVTSASALLKELIDKKTVTVAEVTTTDGRTTYVVDGPAAGMSAQELASSSAATEVGTNPLNLTQYAAYWYSQAAAVSDPNHIPAFTLSGSFSLTSDSQIRTALGLQADDACFLDVSVTELLTNDGSIRLNVCSKNATNPFEQHLVFSGTVSRNTSDTSYDEVTGTSVNAEGYVEPQITKHTTTIRTTTLTWALTGVDTIGGGST